MYKMYKQKPLILGRKVKNDIREVWDRDHALDTWFLVSMNADYTADIISDIYQCKFDCIPITQLK